MTIIIIIWNDRPVLRGGGRKCSLDVARRNSIHSWLLLRLYASCKCRLIGRIGQRHSVSGRRKGPPGQKFTGYVHARRRICIENSRVRAGSERWSALRNFFFLFFLFFFFFSLSSAHFWSGNDVKTMLLSYGWFWTVLIRGVLVTILGKPFTEPRNGHTTWFNVVLFYKYYLFLRNIIVIIFGCTRTRILTCLRVTICVHLVLS